MSARPLFVAADGRLQAPWRLLLFLFLTVVCAGIIAAAGRTIFRAADRLAGVDGTAGIYGAVAGIVIAHAIMLRWIDKRPWSYVWLDRAAARPIVLARGWLLGAIPILVPSLVLLGIGWLALKPAADGSWWVGAVQVSLVLIPAAFFEELVSRGYLFASLREWLGWPAALTVTSVGFGLLHLGNEGADARSVALVILAGFFLGAVLIVTRSLYAAWMTHLAWNWTMAVLLHVSVSGVPFVKPDYAIVDAGPDWITGGMWGPEGGAGAAAGMLGGLGYLYWRFNKKKNERREG